MCNCCGQQRPYPTEPGKWEYATDPALADMMGKKLIWNPVIVKADEEGMTITPVGEDEPIWWPNNAMWRKVE